MLYALTIAYDGTDFHGWQRQIRPASAPEEEPTELRTVQGTLEGALQEVLRLRTHVVGASRTDAGVHAWGQVAVFTPPPTGMRMPEERLAEALNAKLPDDVRVRSCARAREGFDPIGLCQAKGYRYTLALGREAPLWDRRVVHHVRDEQLDLQAMRRCALQLIGRRDFAAMAKAGHGRLSTVRTLFRVDISEPAPGRVAIDVVGDGFLHHMVRILAGTLLEAGRGRLDAERVAQALAAQDRAQLGPTLPPSGLRLEWIRYPAGWLEALGP